MVILTGIFFSWIENAFFIRSKNLMSTIGELVVEYLEQRSNNDVGILFIGRIPVIVFWTFIIIRFIAIVGLSMEWYIEWCLNEKKKNGIAYPYCYVILYDAVHAFRVKCIILHRYLYTYQTLLLFRTFKSFNFIKLRIIDRVLGKYALFIRTKW